MKTCRGWGHKHHNDAAGRGKHRELSRQVVRHSPEKNLACRQVAADAFFQHGSSFLAACHQTHSHPHAGASRLCLRCRFTHPRIPSSSLLDCCASGRTQPALPPVSCSRPPTFHRLDLHRGLLGAATRRRAEGVRRFRIRLDARNHSARAPDSPDALAVGSNFPARCLSHNAPNTPAMAADAVLHARATPLPPTQQQPVFFFLLLVVFFDVTLLEDVLTGGSCGAGVGVVCITRPAESPACWPSPGSCA